MTKPVVRNRAKRRGRSIEEDATTVRGLRTQGPWLLSNHRIADRVIRSDNVTKFLNVDLDIRARFDLRPLATAFGKNVVVLYTGHERRLYSAHLELARQPKNADAAIRDFTVMVHGLPRSHRKLWDAATTRDFNIGVQSVTQDKPYEIKLAVSTIQAVSSLSARIVVTIYAPNLLANGKP